jgi:dienelactone hydrolase
METAQVDDIPVIFARPDAASSVRRLAIWMHFLGGTKEVVAPFLSRLAAAGVTALSFDAWQHGERTQEPLDQLMARAFGQFRRNVWPILGHTTLDAMQILDWAVERFQPEEVVAGGVSMGGDISVALAGIDDRIRRVAAMIATPDWTRPGMRMLTDPETVIDQGEPTPYGQWLFDHLNPMKHLDSFARAPAIAFDLGENDLHINADNAIAFKAALAPDHPEAADQVQIRIHPGLDHLGAGRDQGVEDACFDWLTAEDGGRAHRL